MREFSCGQVTEHKQAEIKPRQKGGDASEYVLAGFYSQLLIELKELNQILLRVWSY